MRSTFFYFLFSLSLAFGQEQKNVTLLDHWFEDSLLTNSNLTRFSGCFGFAHHGKEYAVIGSTEGAHFFWLSPSDKLIPAGFVEGRFSSSLVVHREFKVFDHYAYAICDEGTSSLQIIDLNYLPDSVVKVADIQDDFFGRIHNLFIDTANALLYACLVTPIVNGSELQKVPLRVFSLVDPLHPVLVWEGPNDIPEVHDCYIRNHIAILNCGQDGLRVYDFSTPAMPQLKSTLSFYQDQGYNHQGWLSPDGKTYVFADETTGKRVKKCSLLPDLSIQIQYYFGTNAQNGSIPHNIMCTNDYAFIAYYNEGLRIFDIRKIPVEVASYDTYLTNSAFKMNGAWGIFSDYPSQRVVVSDRQGGLFLFHFDQERLAVNPQEDFLIYPNPVGAGEEYWVQAAGNELTHFTVELCNALGEVVDSGRSAFNSYLAMRANVTQGMYFLKISYVNYLGESITTTKRLVVN